MAKENFFSRKMTEKTDAQLQEYINNKSMFQENAVLAAIWELEKREKASEEAKNLGAQIEQQQIIEEPKESNPNIVDDPTAPQLYTQKFILVFGVLFSVLAGGILMAINFKQIGKSKIGWIALISSLVYSVVQIIIIDFIPVTTSLISITFSLAGIYLLETVFWKRHVPEDLKFRKRSIWVPLIIGIVISLPFMYLMFLGGEG